MIFSDIKIIHFIYNLADDKYSVLHSTEVETDHRLTLLQVLLSQLKQQLHVAQASLLHAAATQPLYPTLHCIRYILEETQLRSVWLRSQILNQT